jgi:hypothetical protein
MKICVHLRDECTENLQSSNLRGEPRWERQALEALTSNIEVTDLYTSGKIWPNGQKYCSKYRGLIHKSHSSDVILVTHDWNYDVLLAGNYKGYIANIHSGPWATQKEEVQKKDWDMHRKIIFTYGYPVFQKTHEPYLQQFINKSQIYCLPVPGAPQVYDNTENFNKKILLYPIRPIFAQTIFDEISIQWALQQLEKDSSLQLVITSAVDFNTLPDIKNKNFIQEFKQQAKVKDNLFTRITFRSALNWNDLMNIYSQTKLMIAFNSTGFGGPAVEPAMYGIPYTNHKSDGALTLITEWIKTNSNEEALSAFDRLLIDKEYYELKSQAYQRYVDDTYTYKAFNANLNKILQQQGLLS